MADTLAISTLVADEFVDALISNDPILNIMGTQVNGDYEQKTYAPGDTVYIGVNDQPQLPHQGTDISIDPIFQKQIPVTVLPWNTAFQLSALQRDYYLRGEKYVKKTLVQPRAETMATQAALLCYDELAMAPGYFNPASSGAPSIVALKTATDWAYGQAALNDMLGNNSGYYAIMGNQTMAETSGDLADAFNPTTDSATAFMKGRVQMAMNMSFMSTANLPAHTNGSQSGSSGSSGLKLASAPTSGDTTLSINGGSGSNTIKKGTLIHFWASSSTSLTEVQPHTKRPNGRVRTFTVTEDLTLSSGAGSLKIYPAYYGPDDKKNQNISAALTTNYIGIVGAASTTYEQAIVMKKKTSASFISLELPDLIGQEVATSKFENITVKVTSGSDIRGYQNMTRFDILCAAKIRQPYHIYRAFTRVIG